VNRVALFGLIAYAAFVAGCSRSGPTQVSPPQGHEKRGTPVAFAPEDAITKLETPEDRVTYLHQLKSDKTFEPDKHREMLEKYSGDANTEVAAAAKELLEGKN
jgi:hypothetical protein